MLKSKKLISFLLALCLSATCFFAEANSLTTEAAGAVLVSSATIAGSNVNVSSSGYVPTDDGRYHLYAQDPYMTGAAGVEVASAAASANASFFFPLGYNTPSSVLFKKFTIIGTVGGTQMVLSNSMYITNPEAIAGHTTARMDNGKKGLLASTNSKFMFQNNVSELGAKQVILNIPLSKLQGGPTVYTYNGKQYHFNEAGLYSYDVAVKHWNSQGAQVTATILVDKKSPKYFINPLSASGMKNRNTEYLALNAHDAAGCEALAAMSSFLATHYSNTGHGQVDNFIVGNEVNAHTQWNYMKTSGIAEFTAEYANAFRMIYNGIKSTNANANVYICTDNEWAKPSATRFYAGRDLITVFNTFVKAQGNIDWRLATHAFDVPLTTTAIWRNNSQLQHSQASPFISIQNIEVVTDYLSQPDFLSPSGQVRTVKLSEQGYSSHNGQEQQAAAVLFALLTAEGNSHIDGIILSREEDNASEISQGLRLGLMDAKGNKKLAWAFYKSPTDPKNIALANQYAGVDLTRLIMRR